MAKACRSGTRSWGLFGGRIRGTMVQASRIYTLAGFIRYSMPYLNPGSLSDEQAQQVAAFIESKPRPAFPFKEQDYRTDKLPVDAVYYSKNISKN